MPLLNVVERVERTVYGGSSCVIAAGHAGRDIEGDSFPCGCSHCSRDCDCDTRLIVLVRQRHALYPRHAKRTVFVWREFRPEPAGDVLVAAAGVLGVHHGGNS